MEELQREQGKPAMATFYKKKAKASVNDILNESHSSTSETTYGESPLKENVSEGKEEVKENLGEESDVVFRMDEKKKREIDELLAAPKFPNKTVVLYSVMPEEAARIKEFVQINVLNYEHVIESDGINHLRKRHWEESEKDEKNVPMKKDDLYLILEIIGNADEISRAKNSQRGLPVIRYKKRLNGYYFILEEIRKKKKKLALLTFYKERATSTRQNVL
ncbi:MAG: hypothetical protein AB1656_17370 [Candidatus Omnitrophota bacterium]